MYFSITSSTTISYYHQYFHLKLWETYKDEHNTVIVGAQGERQRELQCAREPAPAPLTLLNRGAKHQKDLVSSCLKP